MEVNYNLRLFEPSDLGGVISINRRCLPENYSTGFFMNLFKRFPKTFIVAELDNEIIGYIMCRIETGIPSFKMLGITRKGHVISIAVLPEHHRKGIANRLIKTALKAMEDYNAKECYLEVRESNIAAINLYKKLAFIQAKTITNYYADGENAILMAQKLSNSHM